MEKNTGNGKKRSASKKRPLKASSERLKKSILHMKKRASVLHRILEIAPDAKMRQNMHKTTLRKTASSPKRTPSKWKCRRQGKQGGQNQRKPHKKK